MAFPFGWLVQKLIPGVIATLIIGGIGFYFGASVKELEVKRLEAQLKEYGVLGQRIKKLTTTIDNSIRSQNQALVEAYSREIDKVRMDFGQARTGLAEATEGLKRGGLSVKTSAQALSEAVKKLPAGSSEREAKIAELMETFANQEKLQQLCAVTNVPNGQLNQLKTSFSIGTP